MLTNTHSTYNDIAGFAVANAPIGFNSNRYLGLYNTSSWTVGKVQYDLNKYIWVKYVWNGTKYCIYGMYDNNYNINDLPNSWTLNASWTTTTKLFSSTQVRIGNTVKTTTEYFGGYIDLNNTIINRNNKLFWSGVKGIII